MYRHKADLLIDKASKANYNLLIDKTSKASPLIVIKECL